MKFQPRPRLKTLTLHGRAHFSIKTVEGWFLEAPLKPPGAILRPLEPPGTAWSPNIYYGLQYITMSYLWVRILGTLDWDLRGFDKSTFAGYEEF